MGGSCVNYFWRECAMPRSEKQIDAYKIMHLGIVPNVLKAGHCK